MRAVPIGRAMARFFGTSSPNTIDSAVAKTSAITEAVPPGGAGRQADVLEQRGDQGRDRGFGEVTGDQRRDGDPELGPGELERQVAVRALHDLRSPVADLVDVGVDLAALEAGQGELGGHEDRGAGGQRHERRQLKQRENDAHRRVLECSPGRVPGQLEGGSASAGPAAAPAPQIGPSARKAAASTVPCGTWSLSLMAGGPKSQRR